MGGRLLWGFRPRIARGRQRFVERRGKTTPSLRTSTRGLVALVRGRARGYPRISHRHVRRRRRSEGSAIWRTRTLRTCDWTHIRIAACVGRRAHEALPRVHLVVRIRVALPILRDRRVRPFRLRCWILLVATAQTISADVSCSTDAIAVSNSWISPGLRYLVAITITVLLLYTYAFSTAATYQLPLAPPPPLEPPPKPPPL